MRAVVLLSLFSSLSAAQDLREIVRRAVELDARNAQSSLSFTFRERRDQHEFDGSGKLRRDEVRTWNVIPLEGTTYRRLLSRNDVPLSAEEQKSEEEKLRFNAEQRKNETAAERQRRIGEWKRRQQQRTHDPLKEVPDAFNFASAGEAMVDGRAAFVIDATPKPGYRPKSVYAEFFPKVRARFWIDKAEGQWVKVEAETLDTISFAGFLFRVAKGTRYTAEQMRIAENVWAPKRIWYKASVRIALVKGIQWESESQFSDYRRAASDAAAAATGDSPIR